MRRSLPLLLLVLAALLADGCKRREDAGPLMMPGEDCIGCHLREPRAPKFSVAGTAYMDHAGTMPAVGATVTVTDSKGKELVLTTNAVGNFFSQERLQPPVSARIELDGVVRQMKTKQPHGSCNYCHRNPPREQAPGRISASAAPGAEATPGAIGASPGTTERAPGTGAAPGPGAATEGSTKP